MRLLRALLLVASAFTFAPTASAHQCATGSSGGDCVCPAPSDGQAHQHSTSGGSCQAAAGFAQSATPGGASQTPGAGTALLLLGIAALTLVVGRK